jgi:integral membrane protein (TIGR01906 family)
MQAARWVATALFYLAVPLFLVLSNVRVATMEPRVYDYSFDRYGVRTVTRMDRTQLSAAARDLVRYFQDDRPALATRVVIEGQEQPLFNQRETVHMQDVKTLFGYVFLAHQIALAYLLAYIAAVFLWARERSLRVLASQLIRGGTVTVGVLGVAAVASVVGFDAIFYAFHVISFANDFWQLNPATDRLIQMFPRDFWFMVTLAIGFATMMEGALLILAGYGLRAWLDGEGRLERPSAAGPYSA